MAKEHWRVNVTDTETTIIADYRTLQELVATIEAVLWNGGVSTFKFIDRTDRSKNRSITVVGSNYPPGSPEQTP
jgi:hypothetical protein